MQREVEVSANVPLNNRIKPDKVPHLSSLYHRLAARMGACEENQHIDEMPLREGLPDLEQAKE